MAQLNIQNKKVFGLFLAVLTIFIWGITFVSTKYLLQSFSALEILFIRFFVAYIVLLVLSPRKLILQKKTHEFYFLLAGLSGITLYQFLENIAISYTTASNVSIIVSICPIFTAITSQIFLKEKHITPNFVIGFVLAILGVALVCFNGTVSLKLNPKGDFLALGAAISWGFYSLAVSKINKIGYSSIQSTRRVFFYSLLLMIPLVILGLIFQNPQMKINLSLNENKIRFSNWLNHVNLLFLGVLASGFCFSAWNIACKCLGTVKVTVGLYLIPVVTTIFAFFVLKEPFTLMGTLGAILTITGLFITTSGKNGKNDAM